MAPTGRTRGRFWTKLKSPTIRGEIMFAMIALTILPLLLASIFFFPHINRLVEERLTAYGEELVSQVENSLQSAITQTDFISQQMTYWAVTRHLLTPSVDRPQNRVRAVQDTQQFISNLKMAAPLVSGVYVIAQERRVFTSSYSSFNQSLAGKPWVEQALESGIGEWVIPPHEVDYEERLPAAPCRLVFSYVRGITAYYSGNSYRGAIQVDLRLDDILSFLDSVDLGSGAHVHLVSQDGVAATAGCNDQGKPASTYQVREFQKLPLGTTRSNRTIIIKHDLVGTGWYLVAQIPRETLAGDLRQVTRTFGLLMALIAIAAAAIALIVAGRIARPLTRLVTSINRFGEGHLQERVPQFTNRDLRAVSDRFNNMADRIGRLLDRIVEEEQQKDRAEIRALQAQVNPHFLYNTLEAIRGIALEHGVTEAGEVAKALSSVFRYSIDREHQKVTVEDELRNVRNYVTILEHRYGDRFDFVIEVPPEIRRIPIVRLVLQPLVENAFFHGLDKVVRHGSVRVSGRIDSGAGLIEIKDNGAGIGPEQLRAVRARLSGDAQPEQEPTYGLGVGLANVHRRIQFAYGTAYGLTVESEPDLGTTVLLRLPTADANEPAGGPQ